MILIISWDQNNQMRKHHRIRKPKCSNKFSIGWCALRNFPCVVLSRFATHTQWRKYAKTAVENRKKMFARRIRIIFFWAFGFRNTHGTDYMTLIFYAENITVASYLTWKYRKIFVVILERTIAADESRCSTVHARAQHAVHWVYHIIWVYNVDRRYAFL